MNQPLSLSGMFLIARHKVHKGLTKTTQDSPIQDYHLAISFFVPFMSLWTASMVTTKLTRRSRQKSIIRAKWM